MSGTRAEQIRDDVVRIVTESGFGAHGLHVLAGAGTAEHRWAPDIRAEIHSVAKTVSVLAAGIAADEGLVDLDAPVVRALPGVELGAGVDEVTLRHLLGMASGIDMPWSATEMSDWPDLALEFLRRPSRGRVFQYANASTYTAMRVLATVVGDVGAYVRPRLWEPLGLTDVAWRRCPRGFVLGGEGIALRTEELARLGRLVRDRGIWEGRRLVSGELVDAMHTGGIVAGSNPGYERYALSGWDGPGPAWRLHGAHGQLILFVADVVVTVTADDHFGADAFAATVVDALTR